MSYHKFEGVQAVAYQQEVAMVSSKGLAVDVQ